MKAEQLNRIFLAAGIVLCLLQVWLPGYPLTGDGPCHLANARILHDMLAGHDTAFYSKFYYINYQLNPNWFATAVMGLLMYLSGGVVVEKIFLSLYALTFVTGFYSLLRKVGGNSLFAAASVFILVFTHALFKGFYNFSFSIAFYFWVVRLWLAFMEKRSVANAALFLVLTALLFFTHLLSFVFAAFTCGALIISYTLTWADKAQRLRWFFTSAAFLTLFMTPFVVLMRWFTDKEGGMQVGLFHHFGRLKDLVQFRYIVGLREGEVKYAWVAGITILALLCVATLKSLRFRLHRYDGFIAALAFVCFVYFFFPEEFLGRVILISLRVQLIVFALMMCIIAYRLPAAAVKNAGGITLFACFVALTVIRISCWQQASGVVQAIVAAGKHVKPYAIVLPLDFAPDGRTKDNKPIADRNWIFSHACQYLGADRPVIVLDNYEANTGYFPLVWNTAVNPYAIMGNAIESLPPLAPVVKYSRQAGITIDYVILLHYNAECLAGAHFEAVYNEIISHYHEVYRSQHGEVIVYEWNAG